MLPLLKPNGPLKHWKPLGFPAVIAALLAVTVTAHADTTIYKWVDKNGVVSYSQNPPSSKDAQNVTSFTVESLPASQQKAANRMLANLDKTTNEEFVARQKRLKAADQKIDSALRRLEDAEHHLSQGSDPTGYDRVGNYGGHARLRDSYFTRVEQLQDAVDQAQQALEDAYAARDAL